MFCSLRMPTLMLVADFEENRGHRNKFARVVISQCQALWAGRCFSPSEPVAVFKTTTALRSAKVYLVPYGLSALSYCQSEHM